MGIIIYYEKAAAKHFEKKNKNFKKYSINYT